MIYRYQVLKQADVVLALFLLGDRFDAEDKRRDFEYYEALTTGDSTLSGVVQSIVAAEVGYQDLALEHFLDSLYVDLADRHHNTRDGVHVAAAGGVWSALVHGFLGMRHHAVLLDFDPRIPAGWQGLTARVTVGRTRVRASATHEAIELCAEDGPATTVTVRGALVHLEPGATVRFALGSVPRLPGRPQSPALTGAARPGPGRTDAQVLPRTTRTAAATPFLRREDDLRVATTP